MTMTEERPAVTDTAAAPTFTVRAPTFARALKNATLFTSPDATRPILQLVRMDVEGNELVIQATDSYALIRERVELEPGSVPASIMLPLEVVAALIKMASDKLNRNGFVVYRAEGDEHVWTVAGTTYRHRSGYTVADFPRTETLWPAQSEATETIGLGAWQLARLGKVATEAHKAGDKVITARISFTGTLKPAVARYGDRIEVLVMPVRI